ncbi:MAG TPA: enoyl-CoA hydratase-related protein [Acidimicrobiia bacterium]|jgi:2-(1,2-epoxy-1,2-dihydrophenyl)acetyl-CoA isomerase|nr:enoyl-CoA hydratase-related protein [Acidimicrobiia bacterium]
MNAPVEYMSVAGLELTLDGSVLRVTLDRPEKRNAVDDVMVRGLIDTLTAAGTDDRVRAIALSGRGEHFCGGADIVARNRADDGAETGMPRPRVGGIQRRLPTQAHHLIALLCEIQIPVVCKVRGFAAGIGLSLALAADFTIAEEDATFWEPFSRRGFTPDSGATWLLPRRVGEVRARELLLLGTEFCGKDAAAWGAIHTAVPAGELDRTVADLVAHLASGPTVTLGLTKWLLHAGRDASLDQQFHSEAFALELSSRTADFREGMAAFRERRPPVFEGR